MDDVVENFGGHVFGGGHGKLGDMLEFEAGSVIDEFDFCEFHLISLFVSDEDIFGL